MRKSNMSEKMDVVQNSKITPVNDFSPANFLLHPPQVGTVVRPRASAYNGIQTGMVLQTNDFPNLPFGIVMTQNVILFYFYYCYVVYCLVFNDYILILLHVVKIMARTRFQNTKNNSKCLQFSIFISK